MQLVEEPLEEDGSCVVPCEEETAECVAGLLEDGWCEDWDIVEGEGGYATGGEVRRSREQRLVLAFYFLLENCIETRV